FARLKSRVVRSRERDDDWRQGRLPPTMNRALYQERRVRLRACQPSAFRRNNDRRNAPREQGRENAAGRGCAPSSRIGTATETLSRLDRERHRAGERFEPCTYWHLAGGLNGTHLTGCAGKSRQNRAGRGGL